MSPNTKGRVTYGRKIQLGLRVLALLGALGSLFCAVVIKGAVAIVWIIRVGVSILWQLIVTIVLIYIQAYCSYPTHYLWHFPSMPVSSHPASWFPSRLHGLCRNG